MLYDNKTSVNNKNKSVKYKTLRYLLLKFCQEGCSFLDRFLVTSCLFVFNVATVFIGLVIG